MLAGMVALLWLFSSPAWANPPKLSSLIGQVAQQEGLDPNLLKAVVAVESKFDTVSVSNRGAVGLMQLMPETAREMGVSNRFNPEQNLRGGARYLRQMMERYPESLSMALAAYNAGPGTVSRFGGIPPFPATKRYVNNVLSYFAKTVPGSNHSPKKIYHYRKKQERDSPMVADAHQRIVRLLGSTDDDDDTPTVRSPRPVPAPKAVHSYRASRSESARTATTAAKRDKPATASAERTTLATTSVEPARSSGLIPYVSARHTSTRYQAKNDRNGTAEEIPIIVLRR
ncbi:MAG: lytic transglycosylase domain-containing protein [Magnetococcus sp. DMHC-8]